MTGDLGPGTGHADDLSAAFAAYFASAAGLAAERGDDAAVTLLRGTGDVTTGDTPVTAVDGRAMVAVDVSLHAAGDRAATDRIVDLLNEVCEPDGYHVSEVRLADDTSPPGG